VSDFSHDQLNAKQCNRADHETDHRQQWLLVNHHSHEAGKGKQVANKACNNHINYSSCHLCALGNAHKNIGRLCFVKEAYALFQQSFVKLDLLFRDNTISSPRHQYGLCE